MFRRINNSIFFKELNHFHKNFAILIKQFFVMNVFEGKIVI